MCKLLIKHRAHIEIETKANLQAFHYAALGGHEDVLCFLLDTEGGISDINVSMDTGIHTRVYCS